MAKALCLSCLIEAVLAFSCFLWHQLSLWFRTFLLAVELTRFLLLLELSRLIHLTNCIEVICDQNEIEMVKSSLFKELLSPVKPFLDLNFAQLLIVDGYELIN